MYLYISNSDIALTENNGASIYRRSVKYNININLIILFSKKFNFTYRIYVKRIRQYISSDLVSL